jgi:hypothetical protein
VNVGCGLIGTFISKQLLTAPNYMYFITDKLSLIMEDVPLELFQHDGTSPYFCFQVMAKSEFIDSIAVINGNPNLKDMYMHTCLWA